MTSRIAFLAVYGLLVAFLTFASVEIYRYVERPVPVESRCVGIDEIAPTQWQRGGFTVWTVPCGDVHALPSWTQVPPLPEGTLRQTDGRSELK